MITEIEIENHYEKGFYNISWYFNDKRNSIVKLYREEAYKVMDKLIDAQVGYAKPIQVQKEIKYIKAKR